MAIKKLTKKESVNKVVGAFVPQNDLQRTAVENVQKQFAVPSSASSADVKNQASGVFSTDIVNQSIGAFVPHKTNAGSFVSSSGEAIQNEKLITESVSNVTPAPVQAGVESAQTASDNYLAKLDQQSEVLKKRRAEETDKIEQQFNQSKSNLKQAQKSETGATSVGLARLGGFLGGSASQSGVLLNLASNHRAEVATLESKKTEAINQANNAISDREFELAKSKVQEVKDIEELINQRKDDFFDQSLQLVNDTRKQEQQETQQQKFEFERQQNTIESISELVSQRLTGDPETDRDMLAGFAEEYDIDIQQLYSSVLQKQREQAPGKSSQFK